MKSDKAVKTFVTVRVAGDNLDPGEVTRILKTVPSHSNVLGEKYSTGRSIDIVGSTGVWLFNTEKVVYSDSLYDHVRLALLVLGFGGGGAQADESGEFARFSRLVQLKTLLERSSLSSTMTLFWHGTSTSVVPKLSDQLFEIFKLIPIDVELDFDKDEEVGTQPRRSRAA